MTIKEILKDQEYNITKETDTYETKTPKKLFKKKQSEKHYMTIYEIYLTKSVSPIYPLMRVTRDKKDDYTLPLFDVVIDGLRLNINNDLANSFFYEVEGMHKAQEEQKRKAAAEIAKANFEKSKQPTYERLQDAVKNLVR